MGKKKGTLWFYKSLVETFLNTMYYLASYLSTLFYLFLYGKGTLWYYESLVATLLNTMYYLSTACYATTMLLLCYYYATG
jgi:hypothetical protein